jgi:hypothetical protein
MNVRKVTAGALAGASLVVGAAIADEDAGFAMPREAVSAATVFEGYMESAAAIQSGFASDDAVTAGLRAGVSYEPAQLEEGMIAYGAIAALQDDGFVTGVDQAGGRGVEARRALAERLVEDPSEATRIDGASGALLRIERALAARAAPLMDAGQGVKAAAYSVQHQAWSKIMVSDPQSRLAEVKSLSAQRAQPSESDNQHMMTGLVGPAPSASDAAPATYSAVEAHALALAAESVLGYAHGSDRDRLAPLLTETSSAQCLRMAKLNLYQCMAVAGPQYEDIYCLGEHALLDTGRCVDMAVHGRASTLAQAATHATSYTPLAAHVSFRGDPN